MVIDRILETLSAVFEAGIAITALSLFIRALTFNLRDRVSRSFAIILACVMVVFSGEAISSSVISEELIQFWLKYQWVGIVVFPAAYFHFSDALMETTGRPSRGRRINIVRLAYILAIGFLISLPSSLLVGDVAYDVEFVPYLVSGRLTAVFTLYYVVGLMGSFWTVWRAYKRTRLTSSRWRMRYMLAGSIMLAVGIYPYLQVTSEIASNIPRIFLGLVTLGNIFVFWFMVLMAYAVGFFGVPWPDRVVKSRLIKWILRGPVTVFVVLSLMTATNEAGNYFGYPDTIALPIITVTAVLLMEHLITLIFPYIEQLFFSGGERSNLQLLNKISERLITTSDLRQFLEAVLASACDKFQVSTAFVAAIDEEGLELVVQVGDRKMLNQTGLDKVLVEKALNQNQNGVNELFSWGEFWLYPLFSVQQGSMLGLLGIQKLEEHQLEDGLAETLGFLGQRAALALEDRRLQTKMFDVLETLSPKVDMIQKLRAASRYDQTGMLNEIESSGGQIKSLGLWVKDALSHYWGGPKLTESPLLGLNVVQRALKEHNNNPANALRAILKEGIEHIRPEGERRFTAEWILYNILEMKFMEGRKVREIALRLAMSEADLYRKQRVAIEAVSKAIVDMERVARAN